MIEEEDVDEVESSTRMRRFGLGEVGREGRGVLEEIARGVEVMEGVGGEWNCQDWVGEVVRRGVERGVLEEGVCEKALEEAGRVVPAKEGDATSVDSSCTSVLPVVGSAV